jgi:murein DD-endopeptidase MepM/ murein hydrolase activator NlpD
MVGGERTLARRRPFVRQSLVALVIATLMGGHLAHSEALYKYRGEDGEWIFTDREPVDEEDVEVRELESSFVAPEFSVSHNGIGNSVEFTARNDYYAPVEMRLEFVEITGVSFPDPDQDLYWVIEPRSSRVLLNLDLLEGATAPRIQYRFRYMPGDPRASHQVAEGYEAPFSSGLDFPITQAYPDSATHLSRDSTYAVDIAMPIGTNVLAARGGVVFEVTSDNYRSGLDREQDGPRANIVRILHEDGTFSLYAHLNWNSIRVNPGDRVRAGQYIADSGNTGFSSGPHLHFSVQRNVGFSVESLPLVFRGSNASNVVPATGDVLSAYR